MRPDHEELVLNNPALGACMGWYFSRAYCDTADGRAPVLPLFPVMSAMLFHRPTVEKIRSMQFNTGIEKAISDTPDIVASLQRRMEEGSAKSFLALQLGCSSGILLREGGDGLPTFRAIGTLLPVQIRDGEGDVPRIYAAAKRLGRWFASQNMTRIQQILFVEF